eukprot:1158071-Pelagomonas_calceolata.AAC.4
MFDVTSSQRRIKCEASSTEGAACAHMNLKAEMGHPSKAYRASRSREVGSLEKPTASPGPGT